MDVDANDAKDLLSALGKVLEVREIEEIRTPDGELDYDTIQRVRHVLLLVRVRLSRTRGGPTNKPIGLAPRGSFIRVRGETVRKVSEAPAI